MFVASTVKSAVLTQNRPHYIADYAHSSTVATEQIMTAAASIQLFCPGPKGQ